ncbi:MAG: hypothetical protein EAX90_10595 [Candidatus Heimdallarchaeota archaeon]|nr:hypothetical protein [Candidatus Heimdallarchaeota archaeon]
MINPIIVNKEKCSGCQACIEVCPRDCFFLDANEKSVFESKLCHSCGHCISICPENAITHSVFSSEEYSIISNSLDENIIDANQLFFLLKSIRSTRKYKTRKIEKEILESLVDISRLAPTGHHSQNVEMVVVNNANTIEQLKEEVAIAFKDFLKKIDNPLFRFLGKLVGKGESIRKAQQSRSRFTRMLSGFKVGKDFLFHDAPVVIVFHAKKKSTVPLENCTIASTYMRIVAHGYNLGSCYIGYLVYAAKYNSKILQILNIPEGNEIFQVMVLGYPKHKFKTFVARNEVKVQWK